MLNKQKKRKQAPRSAFFMPYGHEFVRKDDDDSVTLTTIHDFFYSLQCLLCGFVCAESCEADKTFAGRAKTYAWSADNVCGAKQPVKELP